MRYTPSKQYLWAGLVAAGLAVISAVFATEWTIALVASILFLISAIAVLLLAFRPAIEIQEQRLLVGERSIPWAEVARVDRTGWISPLIVNLTLVNEEKILIVFPGDLDSSNSLLRHLRRNAREALIDGIPHRQFWGDALPPAETPKQLTAPKVQLLRSEDEAEVERLYQLLKTVGHLDTRQQDEK
jgi:uncharacterized membrane protein YhaH (DUF805 family)